MLKLVGDDYDEIVDSSILKTYLEHFEEDAFEKMNNLSGNDCYVNLIGEKEIIIELTHKLVFKLHTKENVKSVHVVYKNASCCCRWHRMEFHLGEFIEFLKLRDSLFGKM